MTITITNNADLIAPAAALTVWAKSTDPDIAALKVIADAFAVPAHVGPGTGTIGSQRAVLSDPQIEKCVRWWCYNNLRLAPAGGNEVTSPALGSLFRGLDIYAWRYGLTGPTGTVYPAGNPALHSNQGPNVICGTLSYLYMAFLAAYGIPTRSVHGYSQAGDADQQAEYWDTDYCKWVQVLVYGNAHQEFANGVPASSFEIGEVLRRNGSRTGILTIVTPGSANAGVSLSGVDEKFWGLGSTPFMYYYTDSSKGNSCVTWGTVTANNFTALFADPSATHVYAVARSLADILYEPNALHVTAVIRPSGMVVAQLSYQMIEKSLATPQVLRPASIGPGTWESISAGNEYAFYPTAATTWKFRVLGVLGNTSNIVTVAC